MVWAKMDQESDKIYKRQKTGSLIRVEFPETAVCPVEQKKKEKTPVSSSKALSRFSSL